MAGVARRLLDEVDQNPSEVDSRRQIVERSALVIKACGFHDDISRLAGQPIPNDCLCHSGAGAFGNSYSGC
jgi:hypothetical protein